MNDKNKDYYAGFFYQCRDGAYAELESAHTTDSYDAVAQTPFEKAIGNLLVTAHDNGAMLVLHPCRHTYYNKTHGG